MIDFEQVREGQVELNELAAGLNPVALGEATRAMTADLVGRLEGATDEDVTFVPVDPVAEDPFAAGSEEVGLAWTLGHVIVHLTASAEESAFVAAELARGVPHHGRSRYEVAWSTMVTIEGCRERLRESERMILATLTTWPDQPHLDVVYTTSKGATRNAPARFLGGLLHLDSHRAQVSEILHQARAARSG